MKIAVFTDTYFPQINGVVSYLSNSLKLLAKNNEVVLFAPGDKILKVEKISKTFKIYWIPAKAFPFYEGYRISSMNYKRVSELLKKENPDIVHAHAPVVLGLEGIISAKRKNIPTVVTYHTHFPDYVPHLLNGRLPEPFSKISDYTVKKMIKHVFKMVDVVTAPTNELVNELKSYGLSNVIYLPNGVDLKKFRKNAKKAALFRKQHKIGKKKMILYLGRVSFEKKIDVLLEAFKMIENDERLLVICGGGPYVDDFKKLAVALGIKNVIFTGYLDDINSAYSAADIYVSASDTETFGLTFIEAMYTETPVIGVKRLGPKELIKNGKTGVLVEPSNIAELANAMEKLLNDAKLCKRMGTEAHKTAKKYSLRKSVEKTIEIYRGLRGG
ncbi:glycosyltransferase [Candidatus Micrarchaeota archaeon]|nr:glycosyltransferase [Candidatus Micrarchaeota archaeon]